MYMAVDGKFALGEQAEISIHLLEGLATISVTIPGRIVRQGEDGIGIASDYIDPFALLSYESLLMLNRHNPSQFMQDFLDYDTNNPGGQEMLVAVDYSEKEL